MLETLTADRDNLMIDSTIIRAHQQATSGQGGQGSGWGRSRGGLTTKIHMLADALGRPLRFIVTSGQVGDITQAPALLEGQAVLADKAYDSHALRETIAGMQAAAVIPSNRSRKLAIPHDARAYPLQRPTAHAMKAPGRVRLYQDILQS